MFIFYYSESKNELNWETECNSACLQKCKLAALTGTFPRMLFWFQLAANYLQ